MIGGIVSRALLATLLLIKDLLFSVPVISIARESEAKLTLCHGIEILGAWV